jgi:hypothetical protein
MASVEILLHIEVPYWPPAACCTQARGLERRPILLLVQSATTAERIAHDVDHFAPLFIFVSAAQPVESDRGGAHLRRSGWTGERVSASRTAQMKCQFILAARLWRPQVRENET